MDVRCPECGSVLEELSEDAGVTAVLIGGLSKAVEAYTAAPPGSKSECRWCAACEAYRYVVIPPEPEGQ